jgi:hypothetical protein
VKPHFWKMLKKVGYKSCYEDFMECAGRGFIAIFRSNFWLFLEKKVFRE